jgi:membrane protein CcdC involved in cytochrome C biogenesis
MELIDDLLEGGFVLFLALIMGTVFGTAWLYARQHSKRANTSSSAGSQVLLISLAFISFLLAYFAIDTIRQGTLCSAWWFLALPLPCLIGFAILTPFIMKK